ncbi:MAG TPA: hypothetical protein VEZ89_01650 [Rubrivivax sp.]|nr:hypothetical protein [Rubrivivax sp.]
MRRHSRKATQERKPVGSSRAPRLPAVIAIAGAAAFSAPSLLGAQPCIDEGDGAEPEVVSLQERVARIRQALAMGPHTVLSAAQTPNWTNWPKWSKWSNWANK